MAVKQSATTVSADRLRSFANEVLRAAGMPDEDAAITADAMAWGELRGLPSHGISGKLAQCVSRIRAGGTEADAALTVVRESPAMVVLDAHDAWGQVAGVRGMRLAVERARAGGVGVVVVRNLSSAAAMGYYPLVAVRERMIGIASTNGPPLMAPWGGTTRLLGNLAHAVGVPSGRHTPILYDSATTIMSTGEMDTLHERGELLPEGVLLDERGEPTRDPGAWTRGLLLPSGGHRGYGLSLVLEVLTGVLAGGARSAPDVGGPNAFAEPQGVAMFLLAIDPAVSVPYEEFVERVDTLIDRIHASPRAPGIDRVFVPGERGFETAARREREGIPLTPATVSKLRALGDELGVRWER